MLSAKFAKKVGQVYNLHNSNVHTGKNQFGIIYYFLLY